MNKRYMDFVPTKTTRQGNGGGVEAREVTKSAEPGVSGRSGVVSRGSEVAGRSGVISGRSEVSRGSGVRTAQNDVATRGAVLQRHAGRPSTTAHYSAVQRSAARRQEEMYDELLLGTVEDLSVDELSGVQDLAQLYGDERAVRGQGDLVAAKARKVGGAKAGVVAKRPTGKAAAASAGAGANFRPPKAQFINQDKVVKRPLSKNVYQKKVVTPKEEPKGPVTIITKPEKQPKVNLVVTIILTIILGAAAGTVAFLLLPK